MSKFWQFLRPHAAVMFEYVREFPMNYCLTVTETYVQILADDDAGCWQKLAVILIKVLTVLTKNSQKSSVHEYTKHHVYWFLLATL